MAEMGFINSLIPQRLDWNFREVIIKMFLGIDGWGVFSLDLTDGKSTLIQVMAWCHQATARYLSNC